MSRFRVLNEFVLELRDDPAIVAKAEADWLVRFGDESGLVAALRAIWEQSIPELRVLAANIVGCKVGAIERTVVLDVSLMNCAYEFVRQRIPILSNWQSERLAMLPISERTIAHRVFGTVPGLSLYGSARLAAPEFLDHPMDSCLRWLEDTYFLDVTRAGIQARGYRVPDLETCVCEFLMPGIGADAYVLGVDGTLSYFDAEAPGLVSCALGIPELLHAYITAPESVIDPFANGWSQEPS